MSHYHQEDEMPRGNYDRLEADRDFLKMEAQRLLARIQALDERIKKESDLLEQMTAAASDVLDAIWRKSFAHGGRHEG